jgi:hypothetical protein
VISPRHLLLGLAVAPIVYAVGVAVPPAAHYIGRNVVAPIVAALLAHPYVLLGLGVLGAVMVLVGLVGIGLARGAGAVAMPTPPPLVVTSAPEVVDQRDELDRELELLLDAEATNPRGVRVPIQPFPLDRRVRR